MRLTAEQNSNRLQNQRKRTLWHQQFGRQNSSKCLKQHSTDRVLALSEADVKIKPHSRTNSIYIIKSMRGRRKSEQKRSVHLGMVGGKCFERRKESLRKSWHSCVEKWEGSNGERILRCLLRIKN